jgi:hypothetical protein
MVKTTPVILTNIHPFKGNQNILAAEPQTELKGYKQRVRGTSPNFAVETYPYKITEIVKSTQKIQIQIKHTSSMMKFIISDTYFIY